MQSQGAGDLVEMRFRWLEDSLECIDDCIKRVEKFLYTILPDQPSRMLKGKQKC
jgi:hypothetical protein